LNFLEIFCLRFDAIKSGDSPAEIRHINMVEVGWMMFEINAYFLGLLLAVLGEGSRLLPADRAFDVVFGLAVTGKK
jgi:hypothetical protein